MSITTMPDAAATIKGPKEPGTRLSVATVKTRAFETLLRRTGRQGLRSVQVHVRDGMVVLRGTVDSYFLKQLAQESIRSMAIEMKVANELQVNRQSVAVRE